MSRIWVVTVKTAVTVSIVKVFSPLSACIGSASLLAVVRLSVSNLDMAEDAITFIIRLNIPLSCSPCEEWIQLQYQLIHWVEVDHWMGWHSGSADTVSVWLLMLSTVNA